MKDVTIHIETDEANVPVSDDTNKPKNLKIYEITSENDSKFRGFFSYRHFKLMAWLFIVFSQIVLLAKLKEKQDVEPITSDSVRGIMSFLATLSLPMLLVSNLTVLINGSNNYKKLLMINGAATLGFFAGAVFVYEHYILNLFSILLGGRKSANAAISDGLFSSDSGSFVVCNIFVDIFLCTLVVFFMNYTPNNHFQGNKIKIFRAMVFIPIIYEAVCLVLKVLSITHRIKLPLIVSPLLTTKSPLVFLIFLFMSGFIKRRENIFLKNNKTSDEYLEFLKTNTNSRDFSKFMICLILIFMVIDGIFYALTMFILVPDAFSAPAAEIEMANSIIKKIGIGESISLVSMIPFLYFYSYSKIYKKTLIDLLIPIASIGVIVFLYFESGFTILISLAKTRLE